MVSPFSVKNSYILTMRNLDKLSTQVFFVFWAVKSVGIRLRLRLEVAVEKAVTIHFFDTLSIQVDKHYGMISERCER